MERSSPSRTAGAVNREVSLAGETYLLSQADKVRKAADEESVVIARRLDMLPAIAKACEEIPKESRAEWRRDYLNSMICGIASPEEWANYYRSLWEFAFRFWNALDLKHKLNPQGAQMSLLEGVLWAYELLSSSDVTKADIDALMIAVRMVSQEDAVKNSSG